MSKGSAKIFVLDTNVVLHDYNCLKHFQDNDVVLPIVLLEELDNVKKGNDQLNFNAREFTRILDRFSGQELFDKGISLGEGMGRLYVEPGRRGSELLQTSFPDPIPDHRIIAIAEYVRDKNPDRSVVLISKDINMRMKAKAVGVMAQDYTSDKVKNIRELTHEVKPFKRVSPEIIKRLYAGERVPFRQARSGSLPKGHSYCLLESGSSSALTHYNPIHQAMDLVQKRKCFGIEPRNMEQTFCFDALLDPEIELVAITGKAGTGKTLLALAAALELNQDYQQIYLARPIVALANRDLGFLPGSADDKINPYMQPLFDNLSVIKNNLRPGSSELRQIEEMQRSGKLVLSALAFIRGRSLSDVYFIVDEAQNLTPHEVKTIITRAGSNTKIVFTGDIDQIDSPYLDSQSNGLSYLINKMQGQKIFASITLVKGERSPLADLASKLL